MAKITDGELLLISKAKVEKLKNFKDGVILVHRAGRNIDELKAQAAKDRLRLARAQLKDAITASKTVPSLNRTAVSRAYYAMYHSARAVTYYFTGGDDHEEHSNLPTKLPSDLPGYEDLKNKLKNARLERNRADYDPYPYNDSDFSESCIAIIGDAKLFLRVASSYLKKKIEGVV